MPKRLFRSLDSTSYGNQNLHQAKDTLIFFTSLLYLTIEPSVHRSTHS
nr:MAG TPA: hypothetical protein [Caudoviricetes sp.]